MSHSAINAALIMGKNERRGSRSTGSVSTGGITCCIQISFYIFNIEWFTTEKRNFHHSLTFTLIYSPSIGQF